MNEIYTVSGDTLEFDIDLRNEDGTAFTLGGTDNLWFIVKSKPKDEPLISETQHSTHFEIDNELQPGVYLYEVGILFAGGEEKTVITGASLIVEPRLKRGDE